MPSVLLCFGFLASGDNLSEPLFAHHKNGQHTWTRDFWEALMFWGVNCVNLRNCCYVLICRDSSLDFWVASLNWWKASDPRLSGPEAGVEQRPGDHTPSLTQKCLLPLSHSLNRPFPCWDGAAHWNEATDTLDYLPLGWVDGVAPGRIFSQDHKQQGA